METINFNDLTFLDDNCVTPRGSFGKVRKCLFEGKTYAYKDFFNPFFLTGKKKKIEALSSLANDFLLTPKYLVKKKSGKITYLTDFCEGKNIDTISNLDLKSKINYLKTAKKHIQEMHELGIIHADLIGTNMMVFQNKVYIIDFDNSSYKNFKIKIKDTNDFSRKFIETYGIVKEVDTFIFNLLTYSIINDSHFYLVRRDIANGNFGVFCDDSEAQKICKSFFLDDRFPNEDYLIDTLDESKFIR